MKLNPIFRDHMVLQADAPIRIFGSGTGTAQVTLAGVTAPAQTTQDAWCAELPPMPAGGPFQLEVLLDGARTLLEDVWLGDVLLCAGQSNMQFTMAEEITPLEEYASDEGLRIFSLDRPEGVPEGVAALRTADGWRPCRAEEVDMWSALGYLTGRIGRGRTGRAIGIINCSQGASVIQSWMPSRDVPASVRAIPKEELYGDHSNPLYSQWNPPGFLYEQMLKKLLPFSFKQVVWYQGESNASPAEGKCYLELLKAMIAVWRRDFRSPSLPFTIVQIADTLPIEGWYAVQEAQAQAAQVIPGVYLAVSADISEREMIHPVTKGPLARRIADTIWPMNP